MKKFLLASLLSASVVSFALAEKIVVAATPIPHAEILEQIKCAAFVSRIVWHGNFGTVFKIF